MRTPRNMGSVPLLLVLPILAVAILLVAPAIAIAAPPVELGTTATFAVLSGQTITNAGTTTINGDMGLHPGGAWDIVGITVNGGAMHLADAVAAQAKVDLITAYNDAAGRSSTVIPTELGGQVLKTGAYRSDAGTFGITGTLTLDAENDTNAVFVFQMESTLITASGSKVSLINGARFCRIFWQVGSSATLGTNSTFVGHIFAMTSISALTGAKIQGQLLAREGSVTLDSNEITNGFCPTELVTTTLGPTTTLSGPTTTGQGPTTTGHGPTTTRPSYPYTGTGTSWYYIVLLVGGVGAVLVLAGVLGGRKVTR
jgi:hypothetical protein